MNYTYKPIPDCFTYRINYIFSVSEMRCNSFLRWKEYIIRNMDQTFNQSTVKAWKSTDYIYLLYCSWNCKLDIPKLYQYIPCGTSQQKIIYYIKKKKITNKAISTKFLNIIIRTNHGQTEIVMQYGGLRVWPPLAATTASHLRRTEPINRWIKAYGMLFQSCRSISCSVFVDIGRIVDHYCLNEIFRKGKQTESENE